MIPALVRCEGLNLTGIVSVIETDASYTIGKKANTSKEKKALQELTELFHSLPTSHPKVLLAEPLLIPGRGRLFSHTFLQQLQEHGCVQPLRSV